MSTISPPAPQSAPPGRRRRSRFLKALPYLLPAGILYGYFLLSPMLGAVRISFFEWDGFKANPQRFVGFDNYVRLFTQDTVFWTALRNSVVWVVLSLLIPMVLSLATGLLGEG